jgi:ribose transport system substrate-binding protein
MRCFSNQDKEITGGNGMNTQRVRLFALLTLLAMLLTLVAGCTAVAPGAPAAAPAEATEPAAEAAEAAAPEGDNAYVASVLKRKAETFDTTPFKKDGPYRIALAAQGPTNSWATLFDEHARAYVEELGPEVVSELLYADANGSADVQVPQVEDLLSQSPDALILVPMGRAALSAPVERAMAQGVPVILCASGVETDNFVTEVGTNLYDSGAAMGDWLVQKLGGKGTIVQMNGIAGVDTAEMMALGAESVWAKNPDIKVLDTQYGNWSTAEAKKIAEQWIAQYGTDIQGIWSGGAQMSQGIIEAYLAAGLPIPPLAGGEYSNGFLRLAKENNLDFGGWHYPNAMSRVCIDAAIKTLKGEPVQRFIDFKDEIPGTDSLKSDDIDTLYNPKWSDDVFGPVFLSDEKMQELGYLKQ